MSRSCPSAVLILLLSLLIPRYGISQPCDPGGGPGGTGPDVAVGEVAGTQSYGSAGGYFAYAFGTTSCNIGTENLPWIENTAAHPIIMQNLYRLHEGSFEQIGMSWMKHGFGALQMDACGCGCISAGNFTELGVGCSDPYTSGLNGQQSNLGARSEVIDPVNGTFLYPPVLQPPVQDLTWRRLRVHGDDLDPAQYPEALYIAEGQYITPHDAAAGNGNNNSSYRQANFADNTNRTLSLVGSTQVQQPGIQAWQDQIPEVTLIDIDDGEGGLMIIGYLVTDLGNGLFQYEYAIQNLNSSRAARSVAISMPSGAVPSNISFHDVEYHSGEIYDGTDWAANLSAGFLEWSTSTFAADPNANALRWGSLYNFRFLATSTPISTSLELGFFVPGVSNSINVAVLGPAESNTDCNDNGIPDSEDLANGTATDCDNNGLLDECQDDCDGDGTADACELINGEAEDCNFDGVPDNCQLSDGSLADCDRDGVPDSCQIAAGASDCDGDEVLDECQIVAGDVDCDNNGVLDICENSAVFFYGVVLSPPIPISDTQPPAVSTVTVNESGSIDDIDVMVDLTHTWNGDLQVTVQSPSSTLVILHNFSGGNTGGIQTTYDDDGGPNTTVPAEPLSLFDTSPVQGDWTLTVSDGFPFDSGTLNSWELIVEIAGAGLIDCNSNGIDDTCEILTAGDCNRNGVLDECDISSGTSTDGNGDGIPDECSTDPFYVRSDANADGLQDISDPITMLSFLFSSMPVPCLASLDCNADDLVDIADPVSLLGILFGGGSPPSAPYPDCGPDPSANPLPCDSFTPCP